MEHTLPCDSNDLVEQLLDNNLTVEEWLRQCPESEVQHGVERLKQEANRYWSIDPGRSLQFADFIIQIGEARDNLCQIALGTMARGDALKFMGRLQEAWDALDQAGRLYLSANDEVGWARTRIGPLFICVELNQVDRALADAEKARAILARHHQQELLVNLEMNLGVVHCWRGDFSQALVQFNSALCRAKLLGPAGEPFFGRLNLNIGYVYRQLGDFHQALQHFNRALAIFNERQESHWITTVELNIASINRTQGHYKKALRQLHLVESRVNGKSPIQWMETRQDMVTCYLALNRYLEAREMAKEVISSFDGLGASYAKARALFNLATAEAELSNFEGAWDALDTAEAIFQEVGADIWLAAIHLWRATIALQRGDYSGAYDEATAALISVGQDDHHLFYPDILLRQGQALLHTGDLAQAAVVGRLALHRAVRSRQVWERYSAHVLLGQVTESQNNLMRAQRHYYAASATVERMQRGLTLTLQPGFLQDKNEALRGLIRLHLKAGKTDSAFEVLEQTKSQVFLSYLTSREHLRWDLTHEHARALYEELEQLREEHQQYLNLSQKNHILYEEHPVPAPEHMRHEIALREKRMRTITEQLYLFGHDRGSQQHLKLPSLADIQSSLPEATLLIEYYNDGKHLWVFALDRDKLEVYPLYTPLEEVNSRLVQLQFNLSCALKVGPTSSVIRNLTRQTQQIAQRLHHALLAPLVQRLPNYRRLIVVPYGELHYLPFHILYNGREYLIERHEVVVSPVAGLITRASPQRPGGALVLAYSSYGNLPKTLVEAQLVHRWLGGPVYCDAAARRDTLQTEPCQVLHIAAHGEFRIDQPDLAYIQLADGQLYTDDLIQHDLSYELIVLSACETGRVNVAGGEELIGLGRGCLYAGAGALVASLWRVHDTTSLQIMEAFYQGLLNGASKASAIRESQIALLAATPDLHPVFWGPFQLIGNAEPLSATGSLNT